MQTFTLTNPNGMTVRVADYGARILSLQVPDRDGHPLDVVLGFNNPDDYQLERHPNDFGAAIGRYANRIAQGRINVEGRTYQLPQNNGPHCLHGGPTGWQYQTFRLEQSSANSLTLALHSPDGDNGFPANVEAQITYTLLGNNTLDIHYTAQSDAPTVINMTNHSYFNLSGDGRRTVMDHRLRIDADHYTPVDETLIPLGPLEPVAGTPFDFRTAKPVGRDIEERHTQLLRGRGYDHNWVLNRPGQWELPCAELCCPSSGIQLQVFTTEPGLQVYTGNFLDGNLSGKGGIRYPQRSAICLETQKFPDSPNHHWPQSNACLLPGTPYSSRTRFHFGLLPD